MKRLKKNSNKQATQDEEMEEVELSRKPNKKRAMLEESEDDN